MTSVKFFFVEQKKIKKFQIFDHLGLSDKSAAKRIDLFDGSTPRLYFGVQRLKKRVNMSLSRGSNLQKMSFQVDIRVSSALVGRLFFG